MDDPVERLLADFFSHDPRGAAAVYLFGSVARGTSTPRSDVDVAILFATAPPGRLEALPLRLEAELERLLHRRVQLVVLDGASPDLIHRVLRDGRLVLDRDRSARVRFEVRARNEYFDVLPYLREYRRYPRVAAPGSR